METPLLLHYEAALEEIIVAAQRDRIGVGVTASFELLVNQQQGVLTRASVPGADVT